MSTGCRRDRSRQLGAGRDYEERTGDRALSRSDSKCELPAPFCRQLFGNLYGTGWTSGERRGLASSRCVLSAGAYRGGGFRLGASPRCAGSIHALWQGPPLRRSQFRRLRGLCFGEIEERTAFVQGQRFPKNGHRARSSLKGAPLEQIAVPVAPAIGPEILTGITRRNPFVVTGALILPVPKRHLAHGNFARELAIDPLA